MRPESKPSEAERSSVRGCTAGALVSAQERETRVRATHPVVLRCWLVSCCFRFVSFRFVGWVGGARRNRTASHTGNRVTAGRRNHPTVRTPKCRKPPGHDDRAALRSPVGENDDARLRTTLRSRIAMIDRETHGGRRGIFAMDQPERVEGLRHWRFVSNRLSLDAQVVRKFQAHSSPRRQAVTTPSSQDFLASSRARSRSFSTPMPRWWCRASIQQPRSSSRVHAFSSAPFARARSGFTPLPSVSSDPSRCSTCRYRACSRGRTTRPLWVGRTESGGLWHESASPR